MVSLFKRYGLHLLLICSLSAVAWPAAAQHQVHAGKPALASGAAIAPDGAIWVVAVEQGQFFVQRQDSHSSVWSERQLLPNNGEQVATNGDNYPKIAFGPDASLVVTYTRPLAKPYTGEIRMLRSTDGGLSFTPPFTVHTDRQIITHRFESVMFDARGDLYTFWIDKRDAERARQASQDSQSGYEGAAIYYNVSQDGGASFSSDQKLADYSCECCRIALAAEPDAGVVALWRHVFSGSVRDHAFARVTANTASTVTRASTDNWVLKACPHHGPGLAAAGNGNYHAVWFGDRNGSQRVRYGMLGHDGKPRGRVRTLPDAHAEHADVARSGKQLVIVWRSYDGQATSIKAWVSKNRGKNFKLMTLFTSALDNDHPRLIARAGTIAVVWRTEKDFHVHRFAH